MKIALDRLLSLKIFPCPWRRTIITAEQIAEAGKTAKHIRPTPEGSTCSAVHKPRHDRVGLLAYKRGMVSMYDHRGTMHPVTVLQLEQCQVLKTHRIGLSRVMQVGMGQKSGTRLDSAQQIEFAQLQVAPKMHLTGYSVCENAVLPPGTHLYAAHFVPGQIVDVQSVSKGKGFQGVMKRWGFKGQPRSHGHSLSHRSIGSIGSKGMGRVLPGRKMAGRMGCDPITIRGLKVLKIDNVLNCIYVRGCLAGPNDTAVRVHDSIVHKHIKTNKTLPLPYPTFIPKQGEKLPAEMLAPEMEVTASRIVEGKKIDLMDCDYEGDDGEDNV